MRETAEQLHLRGLHAAGRCADRALPDGRKVAIRLLQRALDLYRKVGDAGKAGEVQRSLGTLYKKQYVKASEAQGRQASILPTFREWSMFFKIGCFGFGGPMAVFSLLEDELVRNKKILTSRDFLEGAVLGDILPGPVTMDIVTYTGYKLEKWSGAVLSTLAFILPSFLIMLGLAMLYETYSVTPEVEDVLGCLAAAVVGLILSVGLKLSKEEIKGYREACILIGAFTASLVFKLDIVLTVGLAGLVGIILYQDDPDLLENTLEPTPDDYAA